MSAKKQTGRKAWRDSSSRKVSDLEAAAIVESFLIEQNLVRTLSEFRGEAVSMLTKGKRGAVKSLNKILHDYVVLREEQESLKQKNASLEQALKAEKMVTVQGHNNMRTFFQKIHESIAQFEAGCMPPQSNPAPSQLQPVPPFYFGHSTPPGTGTGSVMINSPGTGIGSVIMNTPATGFASALANTPGSVIAPYSAEPNNKRTIHSIPNNSGASVTAPKKARQNTGSAVTTPPDARKSPPWAMCGSVRKTSLNSVRTVPSKPSTEPVPHSRRKGSKQPVSPNLPHSAPLQPPPVASISPLITSKSLPSDPIPQVELIAQKASDLNPPATSTSGDQNAFHLCRRTPLPTFTSTTSTPSLAPPHRPPSEDLHPQHGEAAVTDSKHCACDDGLASDQLTTSCNTCLRDPENDKGVPDRNTGDVTQDRTSPDSRPCGSGARKMKPSKTMRPLSFSSGEMNSEEGPPAEPTAVAPTEDSAAAAADPESPNVTDSGSSLSASQATVSPGGSPVSTMDCALFLEDDDQLCGDLVPIDDILAILNDTSFSDMVGHVLTDGECMHLPTSSNPDQARLQVGEESFGFHGLFSKLNSHQPQPDSSLGGSEKVLTPINVNSADDVALRRKSNSPLLKRSPAQSVEEGEKSKSSLDKENVLEAGAA